MIQTFGGFLSLVLPVGVLHECTSAFFEEGSRFRILTVNEHIESGWEGRFHSVEHGGSVTLALMLWMNVKVLKLVVATRRETNNFAVKLGDFYFGDWDEIALHPLSNGVVIVN